MKNNLKDFINIEISSKRLPIYLKILYVYYFGRPWQRSILLYRLAKSLQSINLNLLSKYFFHKLSRDYGVYIDNNAQIEIGFKMPHPTSIIIGYGVHIKKNVTIYQNVTLGGLRKGDWKKNNYPTIGENTIIFSGAAVLGKINILHNCIVGANSVVNKSFTANSTIAGIPAKVIKKGNHNEQIIS